MGMIKKIYDFIFSPFTIHQTSDDDEALMTKGQFKAINENLDSLLVSYKSSSNYEYLLQSHKALIKTLTKEHAKSLATSIKAVEDSEKTVKETTENVKKLLAEFMKFMADFRISSAQNTTAANQVITILRTTLQNEK